MSDPFGRDKEKPEEGGWLPPRPDTPERGSFGERFGVPGRDPQFDAPVPPQQPFGGPPPVRNSGRATASLVLGIVGLILCPFICSVLALVFGYQARREIDASGGAIGGRGNAKAGIILGWVGIAFAILGMILVAAGVAALDFVINEPQVRDALRPA